MLEKTLEVQFILIFFGLAALIFPLTYYMVWVQFKQKSNYTSLKNAQISDLKFTNTTKKGNGWTVTLTEMQINTLKNEIFSSYLIVCHDNSKREGNENKEYICGTDIHTPFLSCGLNYPYSIQVIPMSNEIHTHLVNERIFCFLVWYFI